jgi:ABC-type sulfate transport system substrate-binding protein
MDITIKNGEKGEKQQTKQILKTLDIGVVIYNGINLLYMTNIHEKIKHHKYLSKKMIQCFLTDAASFFPDVLLAASLVIPKRAKTAGTN